MRSPAPPPPPRAQSSRASIVQRISSTAASRFSNGSVPCSVASATAWPVIGSKQECQKVLVSHGTATATAEESVAPRPARWASFVYFASARHAVVTNLCRGALPPPCTNIVKTSTSATAAAQILQPTAGQHTVAIQAALLHWDIPQTPRPRVPVRVPHVARRARAKRRESHPSSYSTQKSSSCHFTFLTFTLFFQISRDDLF
jgi:hypothetical protein